MPGVQVDGNDVLACYAVMAEAAERARRGDGPTLIEAVTYRMAPHTTSDDSVRYQPRGDLEYWTTRDPISRYRTFLQSEGVWNERLEKRVASRSKRLRSELRDGVIHDPDIDISEMFDSVYETITPDLATQRNSLIAELAKEI